MPGKLRPRARGWHARKTLTVLIAVSAPLAVGLVGAAGSSKTNVIVGTSHPDHLIGTGGADLIKGKGANDRLEGRGGPDTIKGQGGFDVLKGQRGPDVLLGGPGGAKEVGGPGRDEFNSIDGKPVGGEGRTIVRARDGTRDVIDCGAGKNDVAYVDRAEDGVVDCEKIVRPTSGDKRGKP